MAKLNDFIAQVKKGLIRNNRFEVVIPVPGTGAEHTRALALMCDSVTLPGYNIASTPINVYGEATEMPYNRTFEPVTMTFYCDNRMNIKNILEGWAASIIDPDTRVVRYYNDYVKNIEIYVQNVEDKSPYMVKLYEAYPKTIQSIQMDASNKDLMKISVTFQYKYWIPEAYPVGDNFNDIALYGDPIRSGAPIYGDPPGVITNTGIPSLDATPTRGAPDDFGYSSASPPIINRAIQISRI